MRLQRKEYHRTTLVGPHDEKFSKKDWTLQLIVILVAPTKDSTVEKEAEPTPPQADSTDSKPAAGGSTATSKENEAAPKDGGATDSVSADAPSSDGEKSEAKQAQNPPKESAENGEVGTSEVAEAAIVGALTLTF